MVKLSDLYRRRPVDDRDQFGATPDDDLEALMHDGDVEVPEVSLADVAWTPSEQAIFIANPDLPAPEKAPNRPFRICVLRTGEAWNSAAILASNRWVGRLTNDATMHADDSANSVTRSVMSKLRGADVRLHVEPDLELPPILQSIAAIEIDTTRITASTMTEVLRRRYPGKPAVWPSDIDPLSLHSEDVDTAITQAASYEHLLEILDVIARSVNEKPAPETPIATLADERPRVQVLGAPTHKTSATGSLWSACQVIAGRPIPLACAPVDPTERLVQDWPHAGEVVRRLLANVCIDEPVRIRPTLLVGAPGTGKTSLLQAVAAALEVPHILFPCSSSSDSSFGGTPARWHSSMLSTPAEAIRQNNIANPVIILDELEKSGRHWENGSIVNVLLPMLERHTASEYYEAALDAKFDLSHVSFVATANTLDISPPLRDRFDIIKMPDPSPSISAISPGGSAAKSKVDAASRKGSCRRSRPTKRISSGGHGEAARCGN
ncbi:MAG: AAA family ATPase [Pseudomonadota bacterium]|nr:AAA family ATPase [Pseudomonadota bacterium]